VEGEAAVAVRVSARQFGIGPRQQPENGNGALDFGRHMQREPSAAVGSIQQVGRQFDKVPQHRFACPVLRLQVKAR
jgi:hypothetical protein